MKVKTSQETVQKLIEHLERFDASTELFLNELPTPEKYAILAMALILQSEYDDFEMACDESMQKVSAQDLTKHLIAFPFLNCHMQDALRLKWSYFEVVWTKEEEDNER